MSRVTVPKVTTKFPEAERERCGKTLEEKKKTLSFRKHGDKTMSQRLQMFLGGT